MCSSSRSFAVKVFDVLYIKGKGGEGQCLVEKPLWRRKLLLSRIIKDKTGIIEIADCAKASTKEEIHSFLVRILEERCVLTRDRLARDSC